MQSINNQSLQDYIKPPKVSDIKIKGFNGHTTQTKVGTVRWIIHDDGGKHYHIITPNSYYLSHAESRLLSPLHFRILETHDKYQKKILPNGAWGNISPNRT